MSPEYVTNGTFSVKSDVFSFGVLILEILTGRKNRMVHQSGYSTNLIGHVSIHSNAIILLVFHIIVDTN